MTPLHYAAAAGDVDACSVLREQFQSTLLHARDNLGKTALHHALYWTREPAAALLLQQGAKADNDEDTYCQHSADSDPAPQRRSDDTAYARAVPNLCPFGSSFARVLLAQNNVGLKQLFCEADMRQRS